MQSQQQTGDKRRTIALIFYGGNHEAFQVVTSEKAFWALFADMAS